MISPPPLAPPIPEVRPANVMLGGRLRLAGIEVKSPWMWVGSPQQAPEQLWLPLDVLVARFGFHRQPTRAGEALEWYSKRSLLNQFQQRTLDDEVALEVSDWLRDLGVQLRPAGQLTSKDLI